MKFELSLEAKRRQLVDNPLRELVKASVKDEVGLFGFVRLGYISGDYTSGRPKVLWDGDAEATARQYPYLSTYTPTAGDRILAVKAGTSWVVLGKIL